MGQLNKKILTLAVLLLFQVVSICETGTHPTVLTFSIKEEIGPSIWRQTQQALKKAQQEKASLIIIHMNTYGGMLIHADSIRSIILNSKIPVWIFIDNNAASAGALISIACDSIYMRKGASIGAATVVNQTGEQLPDKYQSYMRSMMRATAEAKGRNPEIAEAMVDPKVKVEGISDSGQVLTFTTSEAMKNGFCEGEAESIEDVLKQAGIESYQIIEYKPSTLEIVIGFLVNPAFSGILIMIIIGGIYFELQTPGAIFPIVASAVAALLYFAPLYLEGLAENWEILIFLAGLILIALEILVIPGFGVAGILGIIFTITGLAFSLVGNIGFDFTFIESAKLIRAFTIVMASLFISVIFILLTAGKFIQSPVFQKLVLSDTQQKSEGYTSVDSKENALVGKQGIATTILRPSGKVEVEGNVYAATAEVGYIEKGEPVLIVKFETAQLVVRKLT